MYPWKFNDQKQFDAKEEMRRSKERKENADINSNSLGNLVYYNQKGENELSPKLQREKLANGLEKDDSSSQALC